MLAHPAVLGVHAVGGFEEEHICILFLRAKALVG